jgi:hypothetical protein
MARVPGKALNVTAWALQVLAALATVMVGNLRAYHNIGTLNGPVVVILWILTGTIAYLRRAR